jgi:hypothetical protein
VESAATETPNMNLPLSKERESDAVEIRKLILKLRWIGHESEAERLCAVLATKEPTQVLPGEPMHTD